MSEKTKELKKNSNKRNKKKQTGFDYMYRIVTAILAVAVFPVAYFMNLIYYEMNWTGIGNIQNIIEKASQVELSLQGIAKAVIESLASGEKQEKQIAYDYISISKFDEFKNTFSAFSSSQNLTIKSLITNAQLRPLVVSLAIFAVAVVLALVILIISIVANKPKIVAALSGAGTALCIISNFVFIRFFEAPLVNGTKSLTDLFGVSADSDSAMIFSVTNLGMEKIQYSSAFFTVMFILLAIFIWSLSVLIVNAGDEENRAERAKRKAKKAEKKAKKEKKKAKKAEKELKEQKKQEKQAKKEEKEIAEKEKAQAKQEKKEAEAEKKSEEKSKED